MSFLACLAVFTLPALSFAFQSVSLEPVVSIEPRIRPEFSAERATIPHTRIRVDSSLVLIPVNVTTLNGGSVTTLKKEDFHLLEDNAEQKIMHFTREDAPMSIGVLFDSSGSMHNKIRKSAEAAATFFKTANVEDEFFLIEFNERPKLTVPFTQDSDELYQRIVRARPFGRTSLLDAIHMATVQMKNARNLRKAIVIVSDGGDNRSRYSASEVKNAMFEADVQVYAMGIFDWDDLQKHPVEERNGPQLLDELAEQSGGRHYPVHNLDELDTISARISNELRNEYMLGYFSTNDARDGKFRRVKVSVTPPSQMPKLRTYYRHGYYAPAE